jgi:hypothetical protein
LSTVETVSSCVEEEKNRHTGSLVDGVCHGAVLCAIRGRQADGRASYSSSSPRRADQPEQVGARTSLASDTNQRPACFT